MGFEKHNQVRGYGIGAKWNDVLGIVIQKSGLTHQLKALSKTYEEQHEANKKWEVLLAQQVKEYVKREEHVRAGFVELNKKFDALQAQVDYNPLIKIFAGNGNTDMEFDFGLPIKFLKNLDNPETELTSNMQIYNICQECNTC